MKHQWRLVGFIPSTDEELPDVILDRCAACDEIRQTIIDDTGGVSVRYAQNGSAWSTKPLPCEPEGVVERAVLRAAVAQARAHLVVLRDCYTGERREAADAMFVAFDVTLGDSL